MKTLARGEWQTVWGRLLLCLVLLLGLGVVASQGAERATRILEVRVADAIPQTEAYLALYFMGDELKRFESQGGSAEGVYRFTLDSANTGYYRFVFGDKEFTLTFPLFSHGGDLTLTTTVEDPLGEAHITGAPEAEAYFTLLREHRLLEDAEWGLGALERMIGDDRSLAQARLRVNEHFYKTMTPIISEEGDRLYPTNVVTLYYLSSEGREGFEKWFPKAWFTYPLVTLDPAFPSYMRRFFSSHRSDAYSYRQQLAVYASLLRQLGSLERSTINSFVLQSVLVDLFRGNVYDVLLDSMGRYGLTVGMDTLYRAEVHETERLVRVKRKDIAGNKVAIVDPKATYTLLILWSDHCTHCQSLLPKLWEVCRALPEGRLAVRAFSIDRDTPARREYIAQRGWGWVNLIEPDDGESPLLEALNGDGTPSLFLLDSRGRLVARPEDEKQLKAEVGF